MWWADGGEWARRALTELIEGGDVRDLFSDSELLELTAAEEEYNRRQGITGTAGAGGPEDGGRGNMVGSPVTRGASGVDTADGVQHTHREDENQVHAVLY